MATDALRAPSYSIPSQVRRPVNRTAERFFFGGMAVLLCVIVVIGFFRTYFGMGLWHAPLPSPILHVHGVVFSLWMILFLVQAALISAQRTQWHRTLGTIAFCLPPLMIVLGVLAALDAFTRGQTIGPLDPAVSLAIPLLGIMWFTVLIAASWRTRRRPDAHKRLILLATVALVDAALGRFPWRQMGLTPAQGAVTGLGVLILLVVAYDLFSLRKVHRSTLWAAPLTFAVGAFSVPVGMTSGWHAFAGFLARHAAVRF